ncbi:hypothetical protein MAR_007735 [Mya arenaria]|uniref:Uncharacterized protein n=1 Tax=Mya arenaria TaxID=6604 RepID=A0ABY7DUL6_MYAAR|nr:hypothetical protein MAR_007698 [Mya arenaria]WAR01177.1 hypothetical protein MAR_007735 [Mya arenaria]
MKREGICNGLRMFQFVTDRRKIIEATSIALEYSLTSQRSHSIPAGGRRRLSSTNTLSTPSRQPGRQSRKSTS